MKVTDISRLGYKAETPVTENNVIAAYTGDLLSDVMGNAPDDSVLITIQAHKNTVAVATLAGIQAIVICNGRAVPDDMKEAAEKERVTIFTTKENQFEVSVKISQLLK